VAAKSTGNTKPGKAPKPTVVLLTAPGSTAAKAAKLANAYVGVVGQAVNAAFAQREEALGVSVPAGSSGYRPLVPAFAGTATKSAGAKPTLGASRKVRVAGGLVIGLVLGALIVLLRELLDKSIRNSKRAVSSFQYPVVTEIPERLDPAGLSTRSAVDVVGAPDSSAAEAYRMLRMFVMFEPLAAGPPVIDVYGDGSPDWPTMNEGAYVAPGTGDRQVILVVSAGTEESRPLVAVNLAATYGEAGQRVIVISTDDIESGYSALAAPGSATPTATVADLASRLESSALLNVQRLSLRPFLSNSGQLVTRAPAILESARELADVVILEAPPLLAAPHGEALVHAVDVVLVVAECGTTESGPARRASEVLRRIGAPVLGVVLTNVRAPRSERKAALASAPVEALATGSEPQGAGEPPAEESPPPARPHELSPGESTTGVTQA
jgi:Mrp family chromosome partitioning ATPase